MDFESKKQNVWEPPFIKPHLLGALNKFGRRSAGDNIARSIFGADVEDLVEQFGSPLFVVGEEKLRSNIRKMRSLFEQRYTLAQHGWSYKTNYTSAICRIMDQEGSLAEVVSDFEYQKARALGVPGKRIIFNGPHKSPKILQQAIAEGAFIQVDHMEELTMLEQLASERNEGRVNIGIRLNFDTGFTEPWSRFGFNLESGQAHEAVKFISRSRFLQLAGLHSHIGTFVLEPRAYGQQLRIMCELMRNLDGLPNVDIKSIDIGGGFPSQNNLQSIYLPSEQAVPSASRYADEICEALLEGTYYLKKSGRELPLLIYESGRALVDDAEMLITSVVGTKRLHDGRRAVILDAGTNLLFTAYWYNHPVKMTREIIGPTEDTVLYGPMCMNIDVVRNSIHLPVLNYGDRLVIGNVGAYNNTQWLQFIEYRPNVVLIDAEGQAQVIRKAENLEVMMAQDLLPPHLQESQAPHPSTLAPFRKRERRSGTEG